MTPMGGLCLLKAVTVDSMYLCYDVMRITRLLCVVFSQKTHNPNLVMQKIPDKLQLRDIL